MRFFYKIAGIYRKVRFVLWLVGALASIVTPAIGYVSYLFSVTQRRRDVLADSPEFVSDVHAVDLWDWLTGAVSKHWNVIGVIALAGVVFLVFLVLLQVISAVGPRSEAAGKDEEDGDDGYGEYGRIDEY